MPKPKSPPGIAHAASWLWCRAKVIGHWVICFGLADDTLDLVPHQARATCRDTLAGCNLASICTILGLPGSGPRLFHPLPCRPFRQTGLARGGVRRRATKTSHRDGTGCDLRRCGGALPLPHTVTHFSRISIGISFLLSIETTPNLSFRGFSSRLCHPRQPGLAPGGLGQFIHTLTLALAHRLSAGFAPPSKQSLLPRQQFASTFEDATFLQPPGRTPSNANRAG
ncbi:hypothetical protein F5883DRAFT_57825 [Diaporthe sp. PMI_573]|nr:hypothetical protein F5883DRAFT_57825 [Diaporthaceae sp. PMI_573]